MKKAEQRSLYIMELCLNDYGRVTIESRDYPEIAPASGQNNGNLYSRTYVQQPVDVRHILLDQYVNIATWLHRNGCWEQEPIAPF